jgi:hypothetical protein
MSKQAVAARIVAWLEQAHTRAPGTAVGPQESRNS